MALPSSGPLSMSQVNVELSRSSTATLSMNDADVRSLADVPSGPISFSDLLGKSWMLDLTVNEASWSEESPPFVWYHFGFSLEVWQGSRSPTSWKDSLVTGAYYFNDTGSGSFTSNSFVLLFKGNLPVDFFSTAKPQDGPTLNSGSASHSYNSESDMTSWAWNNQTRPARWDGTGSSTVIIK